MNKEEIIVDEDGNKICNCQAPQQSIFPDGRYRCLICWGIWYR